MGSQNEPFNSFCLIWRELWDSFLTFFFFFFSYRIRDRVVVKPGAVINPITMDFKHTPAFQKGEVRKAKEKEKEREERMKQREARKGRGRGRGRGKGRGAKGRGAKGGEKN